MEVLIKITVICYINISVYLIYFMLVSLKLYIFAALDQNLLSDTINTDVAASPFISSHYSGHLFLVVFLLFAIEFIFKVMKTVFLCNYYFLELE